MPDHPAMRISAQIMLDFIKFSLLTLFILMLAVGGRARADQSKKSHLQPVVDSSENYKVHCMKKRKDEKKCDMMVELLKNLEDAKKLQTSAQ